MFRQGKAVGSKITTYIQVVPRLRMQEIVPPLPIRLHCVVFTSEPSMSLVYPMRGSTV